MDTEFKFKIGDRVVYIDKYKGEIINRDNCGASNRQYLVDFPEDTKIIIIDNITSSSQSIAVLECDMKLDKQYYRNKTIDSIIN